VAEETVVGENWPDVAIELDGLRAQRQCGKPASPQ